GLGGGLLLWLLLWLFLWPPVDQMEAARRRIHPGMARAEAKAVLGPPAEDYLIFRRDGAVDHQLCWEFDGGRLYAELDYPSERVLRVRVLRDKPTRWEWLRAWRPW